ncbi:DUF397 domain-containing protein [Streptomyces sp. NPDC047002]|uniref:DUF397 domain-containing protein n=1 Tax=Streptomyces sp. NPDC047002 TaxID=3155475 RepID=UPI003456728C
MMRERTAGSGDGLVWFKSSHSGNDNPDCVEVADAAETVLVRDSKDAAGPRLGFPRAAWTRFVSHAPRP